MLAIDIKLILYFNECHIFLIKYKHQLIAYNNNK